MFLNYKMMFLFTLMLGTMISISSNSWPAMWLGLELNLLSFIPIMINNKNILTSEASLKYFLVQAMASSVLLFSIIISMMLNESMTINFLKISDISFIMLNLKLGSAPLHYWFPSVMEGLSWFNCFLLMTWQKIAPFLMISYLNTSSLIYDVFIMTNIIIGSIGGINQLSLHKLMAFSSISHIGWLLFSIKLNLSLWLIYFLIYSLISFSIVLIFHLTFSHYLIHLILKLKLFYSMKLMLLINFLSLGGLPPFIGFLPKWLTIQFSSENYQIFLNFILIIFTLITLLFYIRICLSSFLMNSFQIKWNSFSYPPSTLMIYILTIFSSLGLLVYSLITFN
nr:NADH dehydrogenase subunit 2 [Polionemobius taprobanensis]